MSFGSDAASLAPEGVFLQVEHAPARLRQRSRACSATTCATRRSSRSQEAVRRLTSLPADEPQARASAAASSPGYFADVVVFDPATIADHATFEQPHQYATGVQHVFVNGVQVLKDGEHTGAKPGRVVRGPGYRGGRMKIPETPDPPARTFTR